MAMIALTEKNLHQILEENEFVLIDFWAKWCGPCLSFQKVIEALAPQYPEFVFASINIEEQKTLAEDFDIRSVPAVMIIRRQVAVYAESGALSSTALAELLDQTQAIDPSQLKTDERD